MMTMRAGWLTDFSQWLWDLVVKVFSSFVEFMTDLFLVNLKLLLEAVTYMIDKMPVPEFMTQNSIGEFLGNAGPTVLWVADVFQLGWSLGMMGTAMVFYIVRRIVTVGIW